MQIKSSNGQITINNNIKSISDFQEIKSTLDTIIKTNKNITIDIPDSLSITSSVIGYLNKLVLKDNINITMKIGNAKLLELLEDLNVSSVFKAQKA